MKRTIVLTGLLTLAGVARATVYYVCDCQAGAETGCVVGSDANNGTNRDTPWRTIDKAYAIFGSLRPGDQILFARGGSFTRASGDFWVNYNSVRTNPIVIADYSPSGYSGAQKPILTDTSADNTLFFFLTGDASEYDEGFVIKDLDLRGSGSGEAAAVAIGRADYVTLDNLDISGFGGGVRFGDASNLILTNSRIFNNHGHGYLGAGHDVLIAGNTFDNNGKPSDPIHVHNLYINANELATNIVIRNNTLTHASLVSGICSGVSLVVHGQTQGLVIENNTVQEDVGGANPLCNGISVDNGGYGISENFQGTIIRGNRVINVGGQGIGVSDCPDCVIEDNVIVNEQPIDGFSGIKVPVSTGGSPGVPDGNAIIRNNSIYLSAAVPGGEGIRVGDNGTGYVVVNNAVYYAGTSGGVRGFNLNLSTTSYAAMDDNIFYFPNAPNSKWEGSRGQTLAQWRALTGFDVHSSTANPLFTSPGSPNNDLSVPAGSPAVNPWYNIYASTIDITGQARDANPDIGAYEYIAGGAVPPSAPINLKATAVSSTTINLTWTAPAGAVTGYRIHRGITPVGSCTTTAFSDTGLTPSVAYAYTVYALNGSQISGPSNAASATTFASSTGGGTGGGTTPSSVALLETAAFPNPAVGKDPTIRAFIGNADELEITIYDAAGSVVHSDRIAGGPTGTASNGKPFYDYVWTGKKAGGVYYAVIHGKKGGDVVRARVKFAVVR